MEDMYIVQRPIALPSQKPLSTSSARLSFSPASVCVTRRRRHEREEGEELCMMAPRRRRVNKTRIQQPWGGPVIIRLSTSWDFDYLATFLGDPNTAISNLVVRYCPLAWRAGTTAQFVVFASFLLVTYRRVKSSFENNVSPTATAPIITGSCAKGPNPKPNRPLGMRPQLTTIREPRR